MILLISAVFPPEPVVSASLAQDIAEALSETLEVVVLSPKPSHPKGFDFKIAGEYKGKFEHVVLNSFTYSGSKIAGRMYESYSFGKHSADFIRKHKSEINCIYLNSWPLLAQYLIVKVSKRYSIPTVLHVQDIYPESLLNKIGVLKRLVVRIFLPVDKYVQTTATKVVTISPGMRSYLVKSRGINESKADVVYNWQNDATFISYRNSVNKDITNQKFTYMFLGNLNRTAAIDKLIYAFKTISIENARLVIAGNGSEKEMLKSIAEQGRNFNIEFCDAPVLKVPEIQEEADVLLLNLKKGAARFALPSKLVAYLFSGKPIIACVEEDTDVAKIIKFSDCGWVVIPEDSEKLAQVMDYVYKLSKRELQRTGENGFNYAIRHLSKATNLKKLTDIIKDTASGIT